MIALISAVVAATVTMLGAAVLVHLGVSRPAHFTLYGFCAAIIYAISVARYINQ